MGIPPDKTNRYFNCKEISQQDLINRTFYLIDYLTGIKTKHGDERYLVKIKYRLEDPENEARKFFTNSKEIKYVLDKIKEMEKFPRRATLYSSGNRRYLE